MKKVAIYARVSSDKQREEKTIDSQIKELENYAKEKDYIVIDRYLDDGWSGALLARPELDRLRDDAQNRIFDTVLVLSPDRLARKFLYQGLIEEELKKNNIDLIFRNRPINDTPEDRMLLGMQGLFSDYEREKIKERTRRGKLHKARNGFVVGSIPPYGYVYIKKNKKRQGYYKINEKEARIVRLIFDLYIKKQISIREIVRELYRRKVESSKGNKKWGRSTVHRILTNESYIGNTYFNKYKAVETIKENKKGEYKRNGKTGRRLRGKECWIKINVPVIIDKNTFLKAQEQLNKNLIFAERNTKFEYLLKGLVNCGQCGSLYYSCPSHGSRFYRCSEREINFPEKRKCNNPSVSANKIENVVWTSIEELLKQPSLVKKQVERYIKDKKDNNPKKIKLIDTKKSIESNNKQQDRLLEAYKYNVINLEKYKKEVNELRQEKKELEKQKEACASNMISELPKSFINSSIKEHCKNLKTVFNNLNFKNKQWVLRSLIDNIRLFKGKVEIEGGIPIYENSNIVPTTFSCQDLRDREKHF